MNTATDRELQGRISERLMGGTNPVDVVIAMLEETGVERDDTAPQIETAVAALEAGHTAVCAVRAGLTPEETEGPACVCPGGLKAVALAGEMLP